MRVLAYVCPSLTVIGLSCLTISLLYCLYYIIYRLVVVMIVYFVVGMIIMKVKFEKTGTDIIPNKGFWTSLPFLVKVRSY